MKIMKNEELTYDKKSTFSTIHIEKLHDINLLLNYYLNASTQAEYPFDKILNQLKEDAGKVEPYTQIENLKNLKIFLER